MDADGKPDLFCLDRSLFQLVCLTHAEPVCVSRVRSKSDRFRQPSNEIHGLSFLLYGKKPANVVCLYILLLYLNLVKEWFFLSWFPLTRRDYNWGGRDRIAKCSVAMRRVFIYVFKTRGRRVEQAPRFRLVSLSSILIFFHALPSILRSTFNLALYPPPVFFFSSVYLPSINRWRDRFTVTNERVLY